ncbi:FAD/NAD(P)-binding protein [Dactylosporangium sp. NPDC051484]|uniref:FAD/NAD(P)-binding protein n=1 Tax=Dactylosporangium sp. NPDC051484 TaxID=3154942 RepID=UPI00344E1C38
MSPVRLAVVGGGPWCVYALERLCAELPFAPVPDGLVISIFERTGRFGAGTAHDDRQPATSYLNRVASQLSFAADESNRDARHLLPADLRPTFAEWCQRRFKQTGDSRFDLLPQDVPQRYLHGIALREMFDRYLDLLRAIDGVSVSVHPVEVVDIEESGGRFRIRAAHVDEPADNVLLVTGQSENTPAAGSVADTLRLHADQHPEACYIGSPYPLGERLTAESVPPGCRLGVLGLGLTSIDLILHLTEGRGGTFTPIGTGPLTRLEYRRSGAEPASIVAVSPSGLFPWCRPDNQKAADRSGTGHAALEHRPAFLTAEAVAVLRSAVGEPAIVNGVEMRQLDFERHVFPLVVLELAYAYYRTLFGAAAEELHTLVRSRYLAFLRTGGAPRDEAVEHLLAPVHAWFEEVSRAVETGTAGAEVRAAFRGVVFGDVPGAAVSPWGHPHDVRAHAFDWRALFDPIGGDHPDPEPDWQARVITHMRRDLAAAVQGNLGNPVKAACDGVWRDLRAVFSAVLDFGGLTAASHRQFREIYLRHYARMSNGAGIEPMRKVLALVESGLLDVSIGPGAVVEPVPNRPVFRLRDRAARVCREVEVMVEGRGHPFDPVHDVGPLYRNLMERGLVRQWRNPGAEPGSDYLPGALDVSRAFHPVRRDGEVEHRLTVLGAPVEGMVFFQLSAARPHADSGVINTVARWADEFVGTMAKRTPGYPVREGVHR